MLPQSKPIFYDELQRRWRRTRRILEVTGALFLTLVTVFFVNALRRPELPNLLLPEVRPALHAVREKQRKAKLAPRTGRNKRIAALGHVPQG